MRGQPHSAPGSRFVPASTIAQRVPSARRLTATTVSARSTASATSARPGSSSDRPAEARGAQGVARPRPRGRATAGRGRRPPPRSTRPDAAARGQARRGARRLSVRHGGLRPAARTRAAARVPSRRAVRRIRSRRGGRRAPRARGRGRGASRRRGDLGRRDAEAALPDARTPGSGDAQADPRHPGERQRPELGGAVGDHKRAVGRRAPLEQRVRLGGPVDR